MREALRSLQHQIAMVAENQLNEGQAHRREVDRFKEELRKHIYTMEGTLLTFAVASDVDERDRSFERKVLEERDAARAAEAHLMEHIVTHEGLLTTLRRESQLLRDELSRVVERQDAHELHLDRQVAKETLRAQMYIGMMHFAKRTNERLPDFECKLKSVAEHGALLSQGVDRLIVSQHRTVERLNRIGTCVSSLIASVATLSSRMDSMSSDQGKQTAEAEKSRLRQPTRQPSETLSSVGEMCGVQGLGGTATTMPIGPTNRARIPVAYFRRRPDDLHY